MKLKRFTIQLVAAGLMTVPLMAHAAGLGKMSVNSALGQPLAAEIELFAADKAELDSLSASLASDQAFRDANVEFAPVLSSLRFSVEKKSNGKSVLKVTSSRPVNDPFVDMLIELNWASGRLVREYTMLLDPPGTVAQQSSAPVAVTPPRAPVAKRAPAAVAQTQDVEAGQAPVPDKPAAPRAAAAAPESTSAPDQVTVKRGDTLGGIAKQVRPSGVSLEQTLVGLYRENPKAFAGNMNRLKSGTTLAVPSAETVASISKQDAAREIKLQSDDWRAYRQSLAGAVQAAPATQPAPSQASSGKVTPTVEDRAKPAPEAQKDVLKLSKATPPTVAAAGKADEKRAAQEKQQAQEEEAIAGQKTLKESEQRAAMLEKQIQDAQKLIDMKEKAKIAASAPEPAVVTPVIPAPAPDLAIKTPAPVAAVEAPVEPTENWFAPVLANPLYWGGALAALGLGGALWWMMAGGGRRRKTGTALDDSIMSGGDVRPTSVIGGAASGGSINTGDTSFLTDFSQAGLGTIDTHDVDPIAEAEVYMAYGRDAQAEEILREAISKNPDRPEIRVKLLEVYAARRNTTAFESVAGELYAALGNKQSPLWDKACEMGRSIDPANPLYGGVQAVAAPAVAVVAATDVIAGGAVALESDSVMDASSINSVADEVTASEPDAVPVTNALLEFESAGHIIDFDAPAALAPASAAPDRPSLDFELPDLDLPGSAVDDLKLDLDLGMDLDEDNGPDSKFDFSGLDLDLGDSGGNELELDEVGTKLDLARAYVEMGDKEGAREILTEVLAEGSDRQKSDAKGLMSSLG